MLRQRRKGRANEVLGRENLVVELAVRKEAESMEFWEEWPGARMVTGSSKWRCSLVWDHRTWERQRWCSKHLG